MPVKHSACFPPCLLVWSRSDSPSRANEQEDRESLMEPSSLICRKVDTVTSYSGPNSQCGGESPGGPGKLINSPPPPPLFRGRRRTALLWSIGGTVFSAVGFICLALFEQYNDSLSELRHDLKHFNETSADLVKKESLRRCMTHLKTCYKELQEAKASRKLAERELQASEKDRREMTHELQRLRERVACVEGRQAATPLILPMPPGGKAATPTKGSPPR
jgi:hypothetical protein